MIATLILDMQGRESNVINPDIVTSFRPLIDHLKAEKARGQLKGIIITSAKSDFLQGGDLESLYHQSDPAALFDAAQRLKEFLRDLERPGVPVVAAMNGHALGTGFELALACHHRIALDDTKIRLGHPEVSIGLIPSGGAIIRLMWLLGIERAYPILIEGRRYSPHEALKVGLVDQLASSQADMLDKAKCWLLDNPEYRNPWDDPNRQIPGGSAQDAQLGHQIRLITAQLSATSNDQYPAQQAIIDLLAEGSKVDFDTACILDSRYYAKVASGQVCKSMISTFWFDKNAVQSGWNRPKGIGRFRPRKIGVIGAGQMGSGIAFACIRRGLRVVLKDVSIPVAERGRAFVEDRIDEYIVRGTFQPSERQEILNRLEVIDSSEQFADCDLVIEAVFENKMVKTKVTREAEEYLDDFGVMATNTISIPISTLAASSRRPANYVGLHFFPPAEQVNLVEIVRGKQTTDETVARAFDFATLIRKTPIVVKDVWGFYAARVQNTYILEGINLLQEGHPPGLVENLGLQVGMPKGPLSLADELGLEIVKSYEDQAATHYGKHYIQHPAAAALREMLENDRPGKSREAGFFDYTKGDLPTVWSGLKDLFPISKTDFDRKDIFERLLFAQILEAGWCLQEGVIASHAAANLGSIYGWGFPSYTGGVMRYIFTYGHQEFMDKAAVLEKTHGQRFKLPKYLKQLTEEELGKLAIV